MNKGLFDNVNITIINNGESDYSLVDDENNNNNNENIANKPGKYEKFTGTISWMGIEAKVRDAMFELKENESESIIWKIGTWEAGTLEMALGKLVFG